MFRFFMFNHYHNLEKTLMVGMPKNIALASKGVERGGLWQK